MDSKTNKWRHKLKKNADEEDEYADNGDWELRHLNKLNKVVD